MATGFKRRAVSEERVAAVESASAGVPIVGDPRMAGAIAPKPPTRSVYEVGMVYDIPLGEIQSNPFNPRAIYTASALDAMALSLSTTGQKTSATCYIDDGGRVTLIEGETRLRGARAAGLSTLRVEIKPKPDSDRGLYEEARAANVERNEQTPMDDALKWKELLAKNVYPTQEALGQALGIGKDQVSRTLSLASLPARIVHAVAESPELMTQRMLNALREFWEIEGDDKTLELILEIEKTGMGYRDVVARRKSAQNGPIKRTRSVREPLSFKNGKGELKSFDDGGRIELSIQGLSPETANELKEKILSVFQQ